MAAGTPSRRASSGDWLCAQPRGFASTSGPNSTAALTCVVVNRDLLQPWPGWVNKPVGVIFRIIGGLTGLTYGGLLAFWGYFGATFKKTPPQWKAEYVAMVAVGALVALGGMVWGVRPSKLTMWLAIGAVVASLVVGGLA